MLRLDTTGLANLHSQMSVRKPPQSMRGFMTIPGFIAALQIAVLTEPITMVKGKDASTGGASLASIQPREQSLINLFCERVASAADLFVAWA